MYITKWFLKNRNNDNRWWRTMKYIFDIDGTIADGSQRLHFILPPKQDITCEADLDKIAPDWESFYKDCVNDKPIAPTIDILRALHEHGAKIIFVTGRPRKYMNETLQWLQKYACKPVDGLFMRKDGDHRPDYFIKKDSGWQDKIAQIVGEPSYI